MGGDVMDMSMIHVRNRNEVPYFRLIVYEWNILFIVDHVDC